MEQQIINLLQQVIKKQDGYTKEFELLHQVVKKQDEMAKEFELLHQVVKKQDEMAKDIKQLYKNQDKMTKDIEQLRKEMHERTDFIQKEQMYIKDELRKISQSVAVIQVEHGEKLSILFDAYTVTSEKFENHEKEINFCKNKLDQHDNELYYLKLKA